MIGCHSRPADHHFFPSRQAFFPFMTSLLEALSCSLIFLSSQSSTGPCCPSQLKEVYCYLYKTGFFIAFVSSLLLIFSILAVLLA